MKVKINPDSTWAKLPMWKKRLNGFGSYLMMAFVSLWDPVVVDAVLYKDLSTQFIDDEIGF